MTSSARPPRYNRRTAERVEALGWLRAADISMDDVRAYLHSGRATDVPFESRIETLAELETVGVIRHIGLSKVSLDQLESARDITDIAAVTAHFPGTRPVSRRGRGIDGLAG